MNHGTETRQDPYGAVDLFVLRSLYSVAWSEKKASAFGHTPWKFNIAPEKWWLEDYFPIGKVTFQGLC